MHEPELVFIPMPRDERLRIRHGEPSAIADQQFGVPAVAESWPEHHRRAERRRLEHRVQASRMETTADEGGIGNRVEITEHTNAIDEHYVGRGVVRRVEARAAEPVLGRP